MSDKFVTASCFPNLHPFCRLRFPCFQTDLVLNSALWRLTASVNGGLPCVGLTCKLSQRLLCNTCPLIIGLSSILGSTWLERVVNIPATGPPGVPPLRGLSVKISLAGFCNRPSSQAFCASHASGTHKPRARG